MDTTEQRTDMPPQYDPHAAEERWYAWWVERGFFHPEPDPDREPYSIVLPPPNVTGALHAGHAFQQSLQDFIIRRARMQGYDALWLPGTDHAGIATQVVVERELAKEGLDRREMGREAFLERVLLSSQSLPFLITGTLTGAALAVVAFAISAVAVPMLMDRDVNVVTAIVTSVAAVRRNWQAMALWAAIVAFFTLLGLATFCIGLAVTLPLISHATWHAYRDLVA